MLLSIEILKPTPMKLTLSSPHSRCRGFTLTELLVVIAIIAILAALAWPMTSRWISKSKDTKCIYNLRQIGIAIRMYANDNNGNIVPGFARDTNDTPIVGVWQNALAPHLNLSPISTLRSNKDWQCPKAKNYQINTAGRTSYAINGRITYPGTTGDRRTRFVSLPEGRRFVLVTDQPMLGNDYVYETSFGADANRPVSEYFRHNDMIHVLWTDLSVSPASYNELMANRSNLNKSLWKYSGAIGN
ncbi:MAG: prepilin-type N-terminal cleavage/methylation domain-containing protein [Verrucomicrobiota bacterium]